jgi:hypothetical protein
MSVRDEMRQAMYDRLLTFFPTEFGRTVPIGLENLEFVQPKNDPYMMCWFRFMKSKKASIGTTQSFIRTQGFFMIDCIVPKDSGSKVLWQMADTLSAIFKEQNFSLVGGSNVTLYPPDTSGAGRSQDGGYMVTVLVPFFIDAAPV